uniref:SMP-LTD domain-containing protein n=1 Tax=Leersia perrieri TaxID=77586 RepID=A0A0D9X1V4_9ORYZ
MLPLQFLLLTVHPVVVMQLRHRAGVLDLRITEWELRGLERDYAPASFDLGVRGSLYADRGGRGRGCRLKGHLEIAIACVLPPPMRLVPEPVMRGVAETVLQRLAEKMKKDVDVGLIADFRKFRREKAAAAAAAGAATRKVNAIADREI